MINFESSHGFFKVYLCSFFFYLAIFTILLFF
ncbi:unnamed protein product [Nezara viridula]|uniref:Uncharacterized protein n=1 Tax=Nezara viridula TaxID=85310 RepID=A0A9P0HTP0_NEZVI|nr:unnamed protein product [Nezara viridula]